MYIRRVDDLGRIVIPRQLLAALHVVGGDSMQVRQEDDKIILCKQRESLRCVFCGGEAPLMTGEKSVCPDCINKDKKQ